MVLAFSNIVDLKNFQFVFAGLDNFKQALNNDMEFMPALAVSLKDLLSIPIVIIFSLFVAILLNKKIVGRDLFRLIFLLPLLLGTSVVMKILAGNHAQVMTTFGNSATTEGIGNQGFQDLVLNRQLEMLFGATLFRYVSAIVSKVSSIMWLCGIQIIIFLGALQSIPKSLYESAEIDGATGFDKFWKITLPMVLPVLEINVVFSVIDSFTKAENEVMTYISTVSFENLMLSYGSAIAWIYFSIVAVILFVAICIIRKIGEKYE